MVASGTFFPEVSGQSKFTYSFYQKLKDNLEIKIIFYGNATEVKDHFKEESELLSKLTVITKDRWRYFNYFIGLLKNGKNCEVIYAQDLVSSGLPAALAKRKGQRLIIRLGGDFLWEKMVNAGRCRVSLANYYDQPKSFKEKIFLFIYRLVLGRCDLIIFNTKWQSEIYRKFFLLSEEKITVIENPYQTVAPGKLPATQSDEIIYAGRFIEVKNLVRLITAFKQIKTDKKLVLIGQGPQGEQLRQLAQDDPRVSISEKISQEKLLPRLASGYLVVMPSITEINPNVAMEALALRVPTILTKEVGISDELKKYFYLFDPLNEQELKMALEYFLDESNYRNWKQKLLDLDLNYSWDEVAKKHLTLFQNL